MVLEAVADASAWRSAPEYEASGGGEASGSASTRVGSASSREMGSSTAYCVRVASRVLTRRAISASCFEARVSSASLRIGSGANRVDVEPEPEPLSAGTTNIHKYKFRGATCSSSTSTGKRSFESRDQRL